MIDIHMDTGANHVRRIIKRLCGGLSNLIVCLGQCDYIKELVRLNLLHVFNRHFEAQVYVNMP